MFILQTILHNSIELDGQIMTENIHILCLMHPIPGVTIWYLKENTKSKANIGYKMCSFVIHYSETVHYIESVHPH